ncbi:MAG: tyrosine--tRNA ligase [Sphaerochaetaceae bacterium]|nr:tyrosine--tRNA ligase [Sphaerochaetaceae bacterium]
MNKAIQTLIDRGFYKNCTDLEKLSDLMDQEKVKAYVGIDPTGPSVHIGHTLPLYAMHHLQNNGHSPIILIGGGTAMIGDPSGKTEMRKMLSLETILDNAGRLKKQISSIIDFSENPGVGLGRAYLRNNADWLVGAKYIEFLREVGVYFKVNEMLRLESVKQRMERQDGITFLEFSYQLLQAYDFYMLNKTEGARLEVGGDDQWGNIVAGIDLTRKMNGPECYGLTFNLITRADGKKMGKSEKGAIFLDPTMCSPYDYYQYWRNTNDADVIKFMKLFTFLDLDEIAGYDNPNVNINEAKMKLAYEQTKLIHGEEEAQKAVSAAKAAFGGGTDRSSMPTTTVELGEGKNIIDLFFEVGLGGATKSEVRRLIQGGGCFIDDVKITDLKAIITSDTAKNGEMILRAGKKNMKRVLVK